MAEKTSREPARDPQDLERLLISRERVGDVDGMVALYETKAVLDCGDGQLRKGREAIRMFFAEQVAAGKKFDFGDQRPAVISGNLALTSTRLPDGSVTAEVARRQGDGTWLWIIDKFSVE
jgi:ketosteroid isomerase-like protein